MAVHEETLHDSTERRYVAGQVCKHLCMFMWIGHDAVFGVVAQDGGDDSSHSV